MRIWSIVLAGAGLAFGAAAPGLASATALPILGKNFAERPGTRPAVRSRTTVYRWPPHYQGRWYAGWYAPGGFGWSRHYDDAVLADRDGRVNDVRSGINWDAQAGAPPPPPGMGYDDDVTASDSPPPPPGAPRHGEHYEGHGRPGVDYEAPPYASAPPAMPPRTSPGQPIVTTTQTPGTFANGYYYPGVTTTTVVIQPAVRTTRSYVTETVISRPVRRRARQR